MLETERLGGGLRGSDKSEVRRWHRAGHLWHPRQGALSHSRAPPEAAAAIQKFRNLTPLQSFQRQSNRTRTPRTRPRLAGPVRVRVLQRRDAFRLDPTEQASRLRQGGLDRGADSLMGDDSQVGSGRSDRSLLESPRCRHSIGSYLVWPVGTVSSPARGRADITGDPARRVTKRGASARRCLCERRAPAK